MGKELHSWEAVLSTQMESTARPSEGECKMSSDSAVQRKKAHRFPGPEPQVLGDSSLRKPGPMLGFEFSGC